MICLVIKSISCPVISTFCCSYSSRVKSCSDFSTSLFSLLYSICSFFIWRFSVLSFILSCVTYPCLCISLFSNLSKDWLKTIKSSFSLTTLESVLIDLPPTRDSKFFFSVENFLLFLVLIGGFELGR